MTTAVASYPTKTEATIRATTSEAHDSSELPTVQRAAPIINAPLIDPTEAPEAAGGSEYTALAPTTNGYLDATSTPAHADHDATGEPMYIHGEYHPDEHIDFGAAQYTAVEDGSAVTAPEPQPAVEVFRGRTGLGSPPRPLSSAQGHVPTPSDPSPANPLHLPQQGPHRPSRRARRSRGRVRGAPACPNTAAGTRTRTHGPEVAEASTSPPTPRGKAARPEVSSPRRRSNRASQGSSPTDHGASRPRTHGDIRGNRRASSTARPRRTPRLRPYYSGKGPTIDLRELVVEMESRGVSPTQYFGAEDYLTAQYTHDIVEHILTDIDPNITAYDIAWWRQRLLTECLGAGPLDGFLRAPGVTDVLVNGFNDVWIDGNKGMFRVPSPFTSDDDVRSLATRLATLCGRRIDDSEPLMDGFHQLPTVHNTALPAPRIRVHALLPPLTEHPCLSLRVLGSACTRLDDLVATSTLTPEMAHQLRALVRSHRSFLVTGGTGTGKTTLLAALLAEVPSHERVLCVEDTRELTPVHPHTISLTTKAANVEGAGQIDMSDLVKQTLRMRPDRIVVGEIRGREIADLLAALNTGHEGGAGTLHANGPEELPARLEALGALAGMGKDQVLTQAAAALRAIIHVARTGQRRHIASLAVLQADGTPAVVWTSDAGPTEQWHLWESLLATTHGPLPEPPPANSSPADSPPPIGISEDNSTPANSHAADSPQTNSRAAGSTSPTPAVDGAS